MRIEVGHTTRYDYDQPPKSVMQILRLTPRPHEGQHIVRWRVEVDGDARLHAGEDAFGNLTHILSAAGPLKRLTARVTGEVDTHDTGGVVRDAVERFPPLVFLRHTELTEPDADLRAFAGAIAGGSRLERLHRLLEALQREIAFDTEATDVGASAAQAFALKRGVCQDVSHIFIACARLMGAPARYVSGHLARTVDVEQEAAHAWAEVHVDDLGWVGFDAVNGVCPTESYVRVAIGLDYLDAAPVRGSRYGGGGERMNVRLRVVPAEPRRS